MTRSTVERYPSRDHSASLVSPITLSHTTWFVVFFGVRKLRAVLLKRWPLLLDGRSRTSKDPRAMKHLAGGCSSFPAPNTTLFSPSRAPYSRSTAICTLQEDNRLAGCFSMLHRLAYPSNDWSCRTEIRPCQCPTWKVPSGRAIERKFELYQVAEG